MGQAASHIVGTIISKVVVPIIAPVLLGLGLGPAGPIAGSIVAGAQAIIGNVQTGSLFAIAQSAAMTNGRAAPAAITATIHAVGLAADGAAVRRVREEE